MGATDTRSRTDITEYRRELVARLRNMQMTVREIAEKLGEAGVVNPDTGEPFSHVTVQRDLNILRERWKKAASVEIDEHIARQFSELQTIKRMAYEDKNESLALRALEIEMKLLGTAIKKIEHSVDAEMFVDAKESLRAKLDSMAKRFDGNDGSSATGD